MLNILIFLNIGFNYFYVPVCQEKKSCDDSYV